MTTPLTPIPQAWILQPKSQTDWQWMRVVKGTSSTGGDRIPLPVGMLTIMVTWDGDAALRLGTRSPEGVIKQIASIPASPPGLRQKILTVPCPAPGWDFYASGAPTSIADLSRFVGVMITTIPVAS